MPKVGQNIESKKYLVIPRVLVFLFKNNEVLLIKGSSNKKTWAGLYNGLGGHVERGESLLEAAKRELKEEAGVSKVDLWLCGTVMVDVEEEKGVCIYIYKGVDKKEQLKRFKLESSKEGNIAWVDQDAILNLPVVEDLPTLLPIIAKQKKTDCPFHARSYYDEHQKLRIVFTS